VGVICNGSLGVLGGFQLRQSGPDRRSSQFSKWLVGKQVEDNCTPIGGESTIGKGGVVSYHEEVGRSFKHLGTRKKKIPVIERGN